MEAAFIVMPETFGTFGVRLADLDTDGIGDTVTRNANGKSGNGPDSDRAPHSGQLPARLHNPLQMLQNAGSAD